MPSNATPTPVTRDVDPSALTDLLSAPPRATLAYAEGGEVELMPARAHCHAGGYRAGVRSDAAPALDGREVVLVVDDGPYWFELRGVSVRGTARRLNLEPLEAGALIWYQIEPRRVLAWDYSTIREA